MDSPTWGPGARDESGAVAVTTALLLTVLLLFSAFVIDLGLLRADRAEGQLVSDMAAASAAQEYEPTVAGSARDACEQAVAYAEENLGREFIADGPGCTAIPADQLCDPSTVRRAFYTSGPYSLMIVNPVQDHDDDGLMQDVSYADDIDGNPCERIGVRISRDREFFLAGAGGSDTTSGQSSASTVSLSRDGDEGEFASLIVLEREGCQTLENTGTADIRVFDLVQTEDGEEVTYPGIITVDTVPDCGGQKKVIQARTGDGALVKASGKIVAHSLQSADPNNSDTYPQNAVPDNLQSGELAPFAPEPGSRITRSPVDDAVNCHRGGYPSDETWSPDRYGQDIPACDEGSESPHIRDLKAAIGDVDSATAGSAPDWGVYPDDLDDHSCDDGGEFSPTDFDGKEKLFVNCTRTGNESFDPDGLKFLGFKYISFLETMRIGGSDELEIEGDAADGTVVYFRTGGIEHNGGDLRMRNVFAYIDATTGDARARVDWSGSSGQFAWQAPLDEDACAGEESPNAACFAPLALWSNGQVENDLTGDGGGGVIGSMFTPNARFKVRGSSELSEEACNDSVGWADLVAASEVDRLNFESAQFFAAQINAAGKGMVRLCPSPDTTFDVPITGRSMIR